MSEQSEERRKVYEQHWNELLETVREWRPDIADQIASIAVLRFASISQDRSEDSLDIPVTSHIFSDELYERPKDVIVAVLEHLGGTATKDQIARTAQAGGWRIGGKRPYYDITTSIDFLARETAPKKGRRVIRMVDEDTVELIRE